jgi:hypothetical protein
VLEDVRQVVEQSVEFQPPQYISFDRYQMDRDGLSLLITKGNCGQGICEKKQFLDRLKFSVVFVTQRVKVGHDCCDGATATTASTPMPLQTPTCMAIFQPSAPPWQTEVSGSQSARTAITWSVT